MTEARRAPGCGVDAVSSDGHVVGFGQDTRAGLSGRDVQAGEAVAIRGLTASERHSRKGDGLRPAAQQEPLSCPEPWSREKP